MFVCPFFLERKYTDEKYVGEFVGGKLHGRMTEKSYTYPGNDELHIKEFLYCRLFKTIIPIHHKLTEGKKNVITNLAESVKKPPTV